MQGNALTWKMPVRIDLGLVSKSACEMMFVQIKLKARIGASTVKGNIAHGTLDLGLVRAISLEQFKSSANCPVDSDI
jgi:hypothetical protein